MSEAEKEKVIRSRDILLAVKDIDVSGMKIVEATELIQSKSMARNSMVKMTWLNTQLVNQMRCKHVKKDII